MEPSGPLPREDGRALRDLRSPDAFGWYLRRAVVNLSRSPFPTTKALDAYERGQGGLSLFGYEEAEIRSSELAGINAFEIVIVLRTADDDEVAERLFVGPGTSADGEARAFVIRGAMLGV